MTLSEQAITGLTLLALGCLGAWSGCKGAENRYQDFAPDREGPVVETEPSPLRSCSPKPRPRAELLGVPDPPLEVRLVRVYHLCLGKHVALLRLARAKRLIVQVVLEYEQYDVRGRRVPRRTTLPITLGFSRRTVRYHRIEWREGKANPDERGLRVRLAAVDFADGKRWTAPNWPPSPLAVPAGRKVPGPLAPVDKLHDSIHDATRSLKKQRLKITKSKKSQDQGS
jgi:hypothetical protein